MEAMLDRMIASGKTDLFIGGEWLPASDGAIIDVVDPATEEHLADVASDSPDDGVRVAALVPFDDLDDVIRQANDTEMGLISYVFTGDEAAGMRIAERLEAGMVAVSRGILSDPATPLGGIKQSGIGREGSHHGLAEFQEPKYIGSNW